MADLDPMMRDRLQAYVAANQPAQAPGIDPAMVAPPSVAAPLPAPVAMPEPVAPVVQQPYVAPQSFSAAVQQAGEAQQATSASIRAEGALKADALRQQADLIHKQSEEESLAAKHQETSMAARRQAVDDTRAEFADLSEKANRVADITDRRTDKQKIMGVLAVALGGLGDAFAGMGGRQTNSADQIQQQINGVIARDMDNQKRALESKKGAAASKLTELGLARQALGDDMSAQEFVTAQRQGRFANQLRFLAAQSGSEQAVQAADVAASKLELDSAQTMANMQERLAAARYNAAAMGARTAATQPASRSMTRAQIEAIPPQDRTGEERAALQGFVDEDVRQATDPKRVAGERGARLTQDVVVKDPKLAVQSAEKADKLQAGLENAQAMIDKIDQMQQLRKDHGTAIHIPGSEARGQIEQLHGGAVIDTKNAAELGAISGSDMALVNKMMGDPTGFTSAEEAKFESVKRTLRSKVNAQFQSRGFEAPFPEEPKADKPKATTVRSPGGTPGSAKPAAAPAAAGVVRMRFPDGLVRPVPADKVEKAMGVGAERL